MNLGEVISFIAVILIPSVGLIGYMFNWIRNDIKEIKTDVSDIKEALSNHVSDTDKKIDEILDRLPISN